MKSQIAVFVFTSVILIKIAVIIKAIYRNRSKANIDLIEIEDIEFQNENEYTILNEVKDIYVQNFP